MSGDSIGGLLAGTHALVIRLAEDERGLRVYIAEGRFLLVEDPEAAATVRSAWVNHPRHLTIKIPGPDYIYLEGE